MDARLGMGLPIACLAAALAAFQLLSLIARTGENPAPAKSEPGAASVSGAVQVEGDAFNLSWRQPTAEPMAGRTVAVSAEIRTGTPGKFAIGIADLVGNDYKGATSPRHAGGDRWERLQVSYRVRRDAEQIIVRPVMARRTGSMDAARVRNVLVTIDGEAVETDFAALLQAAGTARLPTGRNWYFDGGSAQLSRVPE